MKNIFNIKWGIMMAMTMLLIFPACTDELNDTPEGATTYSSDNVFGADLSKYTQFLAKVYGGLAVSGPNGAGSSDIQGIDNGFGQYIRAYFMMQEVPTDEAILGWTGDAGVIDMGAGTFAANNPFINAMYQRIMYQVAVCNEFLRQTTPDKLSARGVSAADQATIQTYIAEVRFLRALSYWHGLDLFGNMSFVTESDPVDAGFQPPQASRADLYNYVESELLSCVTDLKAPRTNDYGRADKAAAWMLLAKLYLNAEVYTGTAKYSNCLNYAQQIIAAGYTLTPNYSYLFLADNNTNGAQNEIIFPVESDGVAQQSYGSTTFIIHASVGGSMNPTASGVDGGWWGLRTRPEFVNKFQAPDSRAMFYTAGQNLNVTAMGNFNDGYAINKFKNVKAAGGTGSNLTFADTDFPMFRLADAYLMYAECVARSAGGTASTALGYVNALRTRAGASSLSSITLDNIFDERARELYWECNRRTDLIRAGKFTGSAYNWQWKGNTQAGTSLPATAALMPIPANVLIANSNLSQNPGY